MPAQHYRRLDKQKEHLKQGAVRLVGRANLVVAVGVGNPTSHRPTASNDRELLRKGFHDLADLFGVSHRVYNAP